MVNTVDLLDDATRQEIVNRHRPIPVRQLDGQCLKTSVAFCSRRDPADLPDRLEHQAPSDWFNAVSEQFGVSFKHWTRDQLHAGPPAGPWIACLYTPTAHNPDVTHAVPMIGRSSRDPFHPRAFDALFGGLEVVPA